MAVVTIRIERVLRTAEQLAARRTRRRAAVVLLAIATMVTGLLVASSAQAVGVVSITPVTVANNVSVAKHGSVTVTVVAGSTTVPDDATRVVMSATVSGPTANGTLTALPAHNAAGASGDSLSFTSGTTASGTFTERPGTNNRVQFVNNSTGSITLTVAVTGYSTQVTAGDIAGDGGSAGQVLTNTGSGAAWQTPSAAYGVSNPFNTLGLNTALQTVASVTVPAGSYTVMFSTTIAGSLSANPDNVGCYIFSPNGVELDGAYGNTYATDDQSTISEQGLVSQTAGGTITAQCVDTDSSAMIFYPTLIATSVGTTGGYSGQLRPAHRVRHIGPNAVAGR